MVFKMSLVISNKLLAVAFLLFSTSLDTTVAMRITITAINCLNKFQVWKEDFDCYMDRMEQYFIENSIAEEKRVAVFLTAIGGPTYELLRNLLSPDTPKEKSLAELKSTLHAHLKPKPLMIASFVDEHNEREKV